MSICIPFSPRGASLFELRLISCAAMFDPEHEANPFASEDGPTQSVFGSTLRDDSAHDDVSATTAIDTQDTATPTQSSSNAAAGPSALPAHVSPRRPEQQVIKLRDEHGKDQILVFQLIDHADRFRSSTLRRRPRAHRPATSSTSSDQRFVVSASTCD